MLDQLGCTQNFAHAPRRSTLACICAQTFLMRCLAAAAHGGIQLNAAVLAHICFASLLRSRVIRKRLALRTQLSRHLTCCLTSQGARMQLCHQQVALKPTDLAPCCVKFQLRELEALWTLPARSREGRHSHWRISSQPAIPGLSALIGCRE
ncbi:unnamed protein product [Effrenium voratum]|uniref:Uncharacterized protein n=1 Tax=Effrenium voratum TaxID=2562239 RepID=A0AA36MPK7_9DINO|nr:unnamed protein product [Effrenium voratum]